MAYAVLFAFAALLIVEVWAIVSKPSRVAMGAACVGILSCGGLLTYVEATASRRYEWAKPRYYAIPVEGSGRRTLKISSIEGLPGVLVKPVPKGTRHEYGFPHEENLPFPVEEINRCGWRMIQPKLDVHFHDPSCSCFPKDYLFEISTGRDLNLVRDGVEIEYQLNDKTRPILSAIDLQVGFPFGYANDLAVGKSIDGCSRILTIGGLLLGAIGLSAQLVRRRKTRRGIGEPDRKE